MIGAWLLAPGFVMKVNAFYLAFIVLLNSLESHKEQVISIFHLFMASLGLFLVISSSSEVAIFNLNTLTISHDKTSCHDDHFCIQQ